MSISLNTDMNALIAQRSIGVFNSASTNIMNRLSSGIRINSAKDDAANLSISTKIDSTNRGLKVANQNIQTGLTKLQILDGYLGTLANSMHRLRDLAVQSANGVYADREKSMINQEAQQLMGEISQGTQTANTDMQGLSSVDSKFLGRVNQITKAEAIEQGYDEAHIIESATEFASKIDADKTGSFIITADLDMSELGILTGPVVCDDFSTSFKGSLDGNGHMISNLTIDAGSDDYVGLIGFKDGGVVKNIALENVDITGDDNIGGLVGYNLSGSIDNCYVTGSVSGDSSVGGLTSVSHGNISNSYTRVGVSGNNSVGGFMVTSGSGSVISNSYSMGNVSGKNQVGGFIASAIEGTTLSGCYSTGSVSGNDQVGGFVGLARQSAVVSNSYSTGSVSGDDQVGGFVGAFTEGADISSSYATGFVQGVTNVGGFVGSNSSANEIDNTNFWNTDITSNGYGANSGTFDAQGLSTEEIAKNGASILGSSWCSNGITAVQKVYDKSMSMQVGVDGDESSAITIDNINISTNFDIDLNNAINSRTSIKIIDAAFNYISQERSKIGANMNSLESMIERNNTRSNELTVTVSAIRDADMGYEASRLAKSKILSQSAMSVMQQAQSINGNLILSLL